MNDGVKFTDVLFWPPVPVGKWWCRGRCGLCDLVRRCFKCWNPKFVTLTCFFVFHLFHVGNLKRLLILFVFVFVPSTWSFLACRDFLPIYFFSLLSSFNLFYDYCSFLGQSLVYNELCVGQLLFIPLCVVAVHRRVPNLKNSNSSVEPRRRSWFFAESAQALCWCINNTSLNSRQCWASVILRGKASKTKTGTSRSGAAPKVCPPGRVTVYSMPFYHRRMYVII